MHTQHTRISALFQDARLRRAFQRIERDASGALVLPDRPKPVLVGGAAVKVREAA